MPKGDGMGPINEKEIKERLRTVRGWSLKEKKIAKTFSFENYEKTIIFVNKVAAMAEHEHHHPDLHVYWGKVVVEIWTHDAQGLTEKDFVLAQQIEDEYKTSKEQ